MLDKSYLLIDKDKGSIVSEMAPYLYSDNYLRPTVLNKASSSNFLYDPVLLVA